MKGKNNIASRKEIFREAFENVDDSFIFEGMEFENAKKEKPDRKTARTDNLSVRLRAMSLPKRIAFAALAIIIAAGIGVTGIAAAGGFSDAPEPQKTIFSHIDEKTGLNNYLTKEEVIEIFEEAAQMYADQDPAFRELNFDWLGDKGRGSLGFEFVDVSQVEFSKDEPFIDLQGKSAYYGTNYYEPIALMAAKLIKERSCQRAWSALKKTGSVNFTPAQNLNDFFVACSGDYGGYSDMDGFSRKVGAELTRLFNSPGEGSKHFYSYKLDQVPQKWVSFTVGSCALPSVNYYDCSDPENIKKECLFPDGTLGELIEFTALLKDYGAVAMVKDDPYAIDDPTVFIPEEKFTSLPLLDPQFESRDWVSFMVEVSNTVYIFNNYEDPEAHAVNFRKLFSGIGIDSPRTIGRDNIKEWSGEIAAGAFELIRRCCDDGMFFEFASDAPSGDGSYLKNGDRIIMADLNNGYFASAEELVGYFFAEDGSWRADFTELVGKNGGADRTDEITFYVLREGAIEKHSFSIGTDGITHESKTVYSHLSYREHI